MTDPRVPVVRQFRYEDFASLNVEVAHLSLLDGNSGHSTIRFDVETGSIWLGDGDRHIDSPRRFTVQLVGSSEHRQIANALRDIADQLDSAPVRGEGA